MVRYADMLIDTPYNLADVEDRDIKPGHPDENQCTYCLRNNVETWYPIAQITVIRTWTRASVHTSEKGGVNSGGKFEWRCPNHPWDEKPSLWAENAPPELQREWQHTCEVPEMGKPCGEAAAGRFDGLWRCERHARPIILRLRELSILNGEDDL